MKIKELLNELLLLEFDEMRSKNKVLLELGLEFLINKACIVKK